MAFKFESLQVWQRALDLTEDVDSLTKRSFPKEETNILTSQIKRAADSVVLNIAEGCTGQSNAVFKQFLGYALRSAIEVVSCLFIGKRRKIINDTDFQKLYEDYQALCKMITALRNTL
ncbi:MULTISPECIES: four helix bundle protein [unclassified Mucilaginibacter]|uniref:four helix bundle protein n=1 Tax=unclassified Mucilaginibacter TaxID=2617802 RepID=UPI000961F2D1|nr:MULTISPECIES: four helix bundle protein [unclassified Mucilaginibacter]OJW14925.1 MAG: four helix bundle protein [Mucilaginibacter sp. 44-25]PLW91534.1 MAG: four helix bundle protein [Mucilaginibacter sp.]HEK18894.1 four helix bundle protein [Bacteroidota bacterium]